MFSVLSRCCIYFTMTFQVFSGFFASVLDACFMSLDVCYKCFHLYVSKVVLHMLQMALVAGVQQPAVGLWFLPRAFLVRHALPSPLLSLSSVFFPPSRRDSLSSCGETEGHGCPCMLVGSMGGASHLDSVESERARSTTQSRRKRRATTGVRALALPICNSKTNSESCWLLGKPRLANLMRTSLHQVQAKERRRTSMGV
jgi:hypothetical protein